LLLSGTLAGVFNDTTTYSGFRTYFFNSGTGTITFY
jgi:hypothetical protein